jgi:hypothetical protein
MALTVYQANTNTDINLNQNVPIKGKLAAEENNESIYISYEFSIPNGWVQKELELSITLTQSGQVKKSGFVKIGIFIKCIFTK